MKTTASGVKLVIYAGTWMGVWRWVEKTALALQERGVIVEIRSPEEAPEDVVVLPTYIVIDSGGSEVSRASGAQSLSDLVELCSL